MPSLAGVDRDAPLRLWGRNPLAVQANYDACYYPSEGAAHLQPPWQPARPGRVTRCPAFVAPAAGGPWGSIHPHLQGAYPQSSACYQPSARHTAPDQQWADGPAQSCHTQQPAEPFPQSARHRTHRGYGWGRDLSDEPTTGQHAGSAAKQQLQQFQHKHSNFGQLWPAPPAGNAASGPACSGSSGSRSAQMASPESAAGGSLCRQGSNPDASGGDQAFRGPYHHPQKHKQHTTGQLGPAQPPPSPVQPEQPQPQQPAARKGPLSHRQRYRRKMYAMHKALEEQQQQEELQRQQDAEQAALLATAAQFSLAAKQVKAVALQEGASAAASQKPQAGLSQASATADCSSQVQQQKAGGQEHTEGTGALAAQLTCMQLAPGKSQRQQVAASSKHWKLPDSLFDDDDAPATNDACGSSWRIPAVPAGGMVDWCSVGCPRMAAGAPAGAEAEADCSDVDEQLDKIDHHLTQLLGL